MMIASSYACEINGHFQIAYERVNLVLGMVTNKVELKVLFINYLCSKKERRKYCLILKIEFCGSEIHRSYMKNTMM